MFFHVKGYEYEVVGRCPKTGRPVVAPIAWSSKKYPQRLSYVTCLCCGTRK